MSVALPVAAALFLVGALALAQPRGHRQAQARVAPQLVVPQGTDVLLRFDQPLSSKTARVGQTVRLHVTNDVAVGDRLLLRAGTPATAVVSRVDKRKAFGVNATVRLALNPVRSLAGVMIPLQPRTQGAPVGGEKSAQAAGATAGGAIVLGPVGLVGGFFVKGKPVEIRVGDSFDTEVAHAIVLRGAQVSRLPSARVGLAMRPTEYRNLQSQPDTQLYSDQSDQQLAELPSDQSLAAQPSVEQMGLVLPQGTDVPLAFDQPLSSDTAQVGQQVSLHVASDVLAGGRVIIPAGTPVLATVAKVDESKPFGVNADIRLTLSPISTASGVVIPLEARTQGQPIGGEKSTQAAGATVGGAALLGPVGLVGGYFIKGQSANVAVGDQFDTDVAGNVAFSPQQLALLPMSAGTQTAQIVTDQSGQQYQCVPVTCVPVASASPAPAPEPLASGEVEPAAPDLRASASGQCPAPVAQSAPAITAQAPPETIASACAPCAVTPAPVAIAPVEQQNYCAGFPDLPTAMDHGYTC